MEQIVLNPVDVDLFVIQDVTASIENLPLGSDNEEFVEEEQVVPKPMDVIVVDEMVVWRRP